MINGRPSAEVLSLAEGARLPTLEATDANGRNVRLPDTTSGRATVLVLGFGDRSHFAVDAWAQRFRSDFGDGPGLTCERVSFYDGLNWITRYFRADDGRRAASANDRAHLLVSWIDVGTWKRRVGFSSYTDAYLVLLDRAGRVVLVHHGPFNDAHYSNLAATVQHLLD